MSGTTRKQQLLDMLEAEPNDPELRYMIAMEWASEGNDEEAVRAFEELIAVAPSYPPAYHMGARAQARLGRMDQAKRLLARGIPAALSAGNQHAAGEMQELLDSLE